MKGTYQPLSNANRQNKDGSSGLFPEMMDKQLYFGSLTERFANLTLDP